MPSNMPSLVEPIRSEHTFEGEKLIHKIRYICGYSRRLDAGGLAKHSSPTYGLKLSEYGLYCI